MTAGNAATQLRETGIALLRGVFDVDLLVRLHGAAKRCFEALDAGLQPPDSYRFNRAGHSVLVTALVDFGASSGELLSPLATAGLDDLIQGALDGPWACSMEQSWVRKKFAPAFTADRVLAFQNWHQDGALGVRFPAAPSPDIPMTELLTCWIPLQRCGGDSPGLEFIRGRQASLLHFTELGDAALRRRFPAEQFWRPELEVGDGLVFMKSVLHRTYESPEMSSNRLSVEYRAFPA